MGDATETTLGTKEMTLFRIRPDAWEVGRAPGGKVAHIYFAGLARSLCHRHLRGDLCMDLAPYAAGDKTCPACLRKFRKQTP